MAEIKSAKGIADTHVSSVQSANSKFGSVGNAPACGNQINKPTNAMRAVFSNANGVYTNLSNSLGRDVEKINIMAEEFELWDNQAGNTNG